MMLFGFGRVPGCLDLGALFLWDGWQSVRSGFLGCEVWRCAGGWWAISAALDGCRG